MYSEYVIEDQTNWYQELRTELYLIMSRKINTNQVKQKYKKIKNENLFICIHDLHKFRLNERKNMKRAKRNQRLSERYQQTTAYL